MIIVDNTIPVAKLRLAYVVTIVLGIILIVSPVFINLSKLESVLCSISGAVLLLLFVYLLIIKPQYVYISVENNSKIIVRNYQAFPVFRKYKAFEINITNIQDYELKNSFLNQMKSIRFSVTTKNKIGKYPWISLSAVPKKDIKSLISLLNKILPPKKRKDL
jgi:hypothetical protein